MNLNWHQNNIQADVCSLCDIEKHKPRNVNIHKLHVVIPSSSSQNVDVPVSVRWKNFQFLNNKDLTVAHLVVTQGMDILILTERWLLTDSDLFPISELPQEEGRKGSGAVIRSRFNVSFSRTKWAYTILNTGNFLWV